MSTKINTTKRDFMLQFILNARLSGRQVDNDSERERDSIVKVAEELYDKTLAKCTEPAQEKVSCLN